jgi:hypothetical protein
MKLRSHPLLNLNEEKENRYVVTMDMYVYAKDDYMARVESHKLADLLKNKYDNQASILDIVEQPFGTMGNRKLKNTSKPTGKDEEMPFESFNPINSPIDLIDKDILDIPDGSVGEIKRAAIKLGIDPQNKYESELRDEIDDLLTSGMSTYEEYELVKKYFGDYADELIHQYGLQVDEEHPHDLPPDDKGIEEKIRGYVKENLRNWFKKEKWKRIDTQGNIAGDCGTMPKGKKTQRCLPAAKARSLSKKDRAATSRKKTKSNKQFVSNTKAAKVKK